MTLFVSAMLGIAGFFGIRMDETHIAQMAAQNAARTAAVTPSTSAVDQAALKTVQASGAPTTWDGQPTLTNSDVTLSQNGSLITVTVNYQAPVVFPQLLSWLGIHAGPTMPITAKATYYNEWGTGQNGSFTSSTPANGTSGANSPSNVFFRVTLATTSPQTTDTMFLNGQPITLTATANNDVSLAQGDALQIYDETTGQWIGTPVFEGTTDSVTVSGVNETDTFVAVIAPWGTTSGELAQSNSLTDTWEATPTSSQLQIEASVNNGATWWNDTNGAQNVWNDESVLLQASLKGLYLPSGYTLSIADETTNQITDSINDESSIETTVQNSASEHGYAAVLGYNGQIYSTDASPNTDVLVNWLGNNALVLTDSYSGGNVTFTATANFPMQSGTANGPYTDYVYLYNESLGQWQQTQGITGNQTQASWTIPANSDSGNQFVAYVESSTTPTAGTYPQSAALPPLESNQVEDGQPVITGVQFDSSVWPPQVTITGTGFGTSAANQYAQIWDHTRGWQGGNTGSSVSFSENTWSNQYVVISGMSNYGGGGGAWILAPTDQLSVNVVNPQTGQEGSFSTIYPANAAMPSVTVSASSSKMNTGSTTTISGQVTLGGAGLANQTVNFSDNGAGGSFSSGSVTTTSSGNYSVTYTAPSSGTSATITASSDGTSATSNVQLMTPWVYAATQTASGSDVAAWNGSTWKSILSDASASVNAIQVYNGDLYVGVSGAESGIWIWSPTKGWVQGGPNLVAASGNYPETVENVYSFYSWNGDLFAGVSGGVKEFAPYFNTGYTKYNISLTSQNIIDLTVTNGGVIYASIGNEIEQFQLGKPGGGWSSIPDSWYYSPYKGFGSSGNNLLVGTGANGIMEWNGLSWSWDGNPGGNTAITALNGMLAGTAGGGAYAPGIYMNQKLLGELGDASDLVESPTNGAIYVAANAYDSWDGQSEVVTGTDGIYKWNGSTWTDLGDPFGNGVSISLVSAL